MKAHILAAALLAATTTTAVAATSSQTVAIDGNVTLGQTTFGEFDLSGVQSVEGRDFDFGAAGARNVWHAGGASFAPDSSTKIHSQAIGVFGVDKVFALMATWWGERAAGTFASVTFDGTNGATFTKALDGGYDIRDYNYNPAFTNATPAPTTTKGLDDAGKSPQVVPGNQRVDMLEFDLPDVFKSETLTSITFTDMGATGFQRTFVAGLSLDVAPVPVPASAPLLLAGLGALGLLRRRRKAA